MRRSNDPPVVLVKWYDATKWILERVDNFPKNQRFIFGQRLADRSLTVLCAGRSTLRADAPMR